MDVLETPRLRLRWFKPANDAPFALELFNDPACLRNIGDRKVHTTEAAQTYLENEWLPSYWQHGFGSWLMEVKESREPIGLCGLFRRKSLPHVDLGYALLPPFYGHGYAREAAKACLEYARDVLGLSRVLAITAPDNAPSQRLLEHVGMQFEEQRSVRVRDEDCESLVYSWECNLTESRDALASNSLACIDALAKRFFAAFDTRDGRLSHLAALPHFCIPEARFIKVEGNDREIVDLPGFVLPRAKQLNNSLDGGALREFSESEIDAQTQITGTMAHRWIHYQKSWIDQTRGQRVSGTGHKSMQLVQTPEGWKIATLMWNDESMGR